MKKRSKVTGFVVTAVIAMVVATAYAAIVGSKKEGLVEYVGAQKDIFVSGRHQASCRWKISPGLFSQEVAPTFSEKEEYLLYRRVLTDQILLQEKFRGVDLKTVLLARSGTSEFS